MMPLFAFPIAPALGTDKFLARRTAGLGLCLLGLLLLVGPEASLPDPARAAWFPRAMVAPFFNGIVGTYVARFAMAGIEAPQALTGVLPLGAALALPWVRALGLRVDPRPPWGARETALVASSAIHAADGLGCAWLVRAAGAVLAGQTACLITLFGIARSMLLLGEAYSPFISSALAAMLAGIYLVQPRRERPGGKAGADGID